MEIDLYMKVMSITLTMEYAKMRQSWVSDNHHSGEELESQGNYQHDFVMDVMESKEKIFKCTPPSCYWKNLGYCFG